MTFPNELWNHIRHHFKKSAFGRPPKHPVKKNFEACVYVVWSGIRWSEMPSNFPPYSTVFYWFKKWSEQGVFQKCLRRIVKFAEKYSLISMLETKYMMQNHLMKNY